MIDLSQSISRTEFHNNDFGCIEDRVDKGDLVFFDPPYTVAHENNGFVKYNQKIFSWEDQERLKVLIQELDRKGVKYILTNAKHKSIEKLYKNIGKSYNLSRASLVGGKGANRSKYNELIITNV